MDIAFWTQKLEKIFDAADSLRRAYGARMAKVIMTRMAVLRAAASLALVPATPPHRRHQLAGDRKEQFAVNLVNLHQLVFEANHEPFPRRDDGGIDAERVTAITILDVIDYH